MAEKSKSNGGVTGHTERIATDMNRVLSNLDPRWVTAASAALSSYLVDLIRAEVGGRKCSILYPIVHGKGHPDIASSIPLLQRHHDVYLPSFDSDRKLRYFKLEEGKIGEPPRIVGQFDMRNEEQQLCIMLVAGIAFDNRGRRIGFSKGFYDQFVAELTSSRDAVLAGVCWQMQVVSEVPASPFRVSRICHERGIINIEQDSRISMRGVRV